MGNKKWIIQHCKMLKSKLLETNSDERRKTEITGKTGVELKERRGR